MKLEEFKDELIDNYCDPVYCVVCCNVDEDGEYSVEEYHYYNKHTDASSAFNQYINKYAYVVMYTDYPFKNKSNIWVDRHYNHDLICKQELKHNLR